MDEKEIKELVNQIIRENIEGISYQISMDEIRKIINDEIKKEIESWSFWKRLKFLLGKV